MKPRDKYIWLGAQVADPGPVRWIEVHAENYMGDGGRPHAKPSGNFPVGRSKQLQGLLNLGQLDFATNERPTDPPLLNPQEAS